MLMIVVALMLTLAWGVAWIVPLTGELRHGRFAIVLGYGCFAGLIGVPVLMRLLNLGGVPLRFEWITVTAIATAVLGVALGRRLSVSGHPRPPLTPPSTRDSRWYQLAYLMLLALILTRVSLLCVEVAWRPLFPFDATMHWATKSRVWFDHLAITPFVENATWLEAAGSGVYTDHHPDYPITTPLLQVWINAALGNWNDSAMNLPWVLCFVALGAAFYGQARAAGCSSMLAMVFTYFLLSMPLLNTHVGLAGYADLFLGTSYCLALMAFHNWSVTRQRSQAILALVFALACLLIKNEGFFWLLTLLPALLVVVMPAKRSVVSLLLLAVVAGLTLAWFPRNVVVAGHSLDELSIYFRSSTVSPTFDSFFIYGSWHLFAPLLVALIAATVFVRRSCFYPYRGVTTALATAFVLFLFLFWFTTYSYGAIHLTAISRISLQLVPAATFFSLLLARALLADDQEQA